MFTNTVVSLHSFDRRLSISFRENILINKKMAAIRKTLLYVYQFNTVIERYRSNCMMCGAKQITVHIL